MYSYLLRRYYNTVKHKPLPNPPEGGSLGANVTWMEQCSLPREGWGGAYKPYSSGSLRLGFSFAPISTSFRADVTKPRLPVMAFFASS